jgi:hypothetical protein
MSKIFSIQEYDNTDKDFEVSGPDDLRITIDNDDVDHKSVKILSAKMVQILNDHWNDKEYSPHADDLALLDFEKWFVKTFESIAEDHANGESIDSIQVYNKAVSMTNGNIVVEFTVDCGRYGLHTGNRVTITHDKKVRMEMSEYLDGGDIDGNLKRAIQEKIK